MRAALGSLTLSASLLVGCAATPDTISSTAAPEPDTSPAPVVAGTPAPAALPIGGQLWPISSARLKTTAGTIYLHNLDARIADLEPRAAHSAKDRETLAATLWHRYRVRGTLADGERALALLERNAADPLVGARAEFLRAVALAGFHRFDEAELALQSAETAGYEPAQVARQRADLLVALGRYPALAEDFAQSAEVIGDFDILAHRADLRLLQGDLAGAERQFWAAQTLYRDINPVPLAWLHTQMGIALLRFGHIERAAEFFAAAVERLPGYYLAEEHLAECEFLLGRHAAARERYLRVVEQTGQPEFMAALAEVEAAMGNERAAADWRARAEAGYRQLVARHATAYAQHAAEFFLDQGDVDSARRLAEDNLRLRQDAGSWLLRAEVAVAEGKPGLACQALGRVRASGLRPPELDEIAQRVAPCEKAPPAS